MRAFLIDDEKMYFKLLNPGLKKAGHILGYAASGTEGLEKLAAFDPDVIILDLRLPDMTGLDILTRLRADQHFSHVPVIFVSGQSQLEDKIKAFELGAEDYLTKPFRVEELIARLEILARRREHLKTVEQITTKIEVETAKVVAIHSLRGGVGCTSLAINLALAYYKIWVRPTVVVDAVLTAGQVAMFLNSSPKISWGYLPDIKLDQLDDRTITELEISHKSGLRFIASPKLPLSFDEFPAYIPRVLKALRRENDLIVLDLPHDFSDVTIKALDDAEQILFIMAPEMASLRAAVCALTIYNHLGYPEEKIKVIMNNVSQVSSLKNAQIEKALGHAIDIDLPFAPEVIQAINYGEPFVAANAKIPITTKLEDLAFSLSQPQFKNLPPAAPTNTWKEVTRRAKSEKQD